ncbi:hypothetical protein CHS0354_016477 [Potamilus streckersoni]|uniref:Uncharacterized protein n=1 Tax=Potamilus streckersoni TaxID=2493646 RepID=A0AAE0TKE9_9BIVA|nr:hypothetical protein CHS0354_016477 [Potamilus streckersoni]
MKGSLVSLFSLYLLATCLEPAYGTFTVPCPVGCTQTLCTLNIGCPLGKCISGWCSKTGIPNVGTICLQSCPAGEYCYIRIANICTACGVSNCYRCTDQYTCDACKTGYTLSSDKRQCTSRIG